MNYQQLTNILAKQKHDLGISEALIAERSGVSQPTVHRILSGQHLKSSWADIVKIAGVLGVNITLSTQDPSDMLETQADRLATAITKINLATNQLEGQGFSEQQQQKFIQDTKIKLLAGPRSKLWMEK